MTEREKDLLAICERAMSVATALANHITKDGLDLLKLFYSVDTDFQALRKDLKSDGKPSLQEVIDGTKPIPPPEHEKEQNPDINDLPFDKKRDAPLEPPDIAPRPAQAIAEKKIDANNTNDLF
jgi:hypothetical protein